MKHAISIESVSVVLNKKPILSNITAVVPTGSIVGLLGPSGSGKTTLIRAVLGLQTVANGLITVSGHPAGSRALASGIGYVSQSPSVYADLSVKENIQYFAGLLNSPAGDVQRVINEVELQAHASAIVGQLSGGQRARVSLAAALLGKPSLLVLDEPTVGLDPVLRRQLWQKFRTLRDQGVTILLSSHVMDEAENCDELLFIRNGRLLISANRKVILQKTKTRSMESAFVALAQGDKNEQ